MLLKKLGQHRLRSVFACIVAGALSACAQTTPQWDAHFGDTVKITIAQQTRYHEAAANHDPVDGIDGRAARAVQERYEKSFHEPQQQQSMFTIGLGGR